MTEVGRYFFSVICIGILCALTQTVVSEGSAGTLVKFITGIVLTTAILAPILQIDTYQWELKLDHMNADGEHWLENAKRAKTDALSVNIKEKTEAYILSKAKTLGLDLETKIDLTQDELPKPESVTLIGNAPPYAKKVLSEYICDNLGINGDHLKWIS